MVSTFRCNIWAIKKLMNGFGFTRWYIPYTPRIAKVILCSGGTNPKWFPIIHSYRLCTEDWHVLGPSGNIRSLRSNSVIPDPYKAGRKSPLRDLPGGSDPKMVKIDIAHTFAIAGYGKDDLASSIIFLAVRCNLWGNAAYQTQLENAWVSFKAWCVANRRHTTILEFSNKELKISSFPGLQVELFSRLLGLP